MRRQRPPSEEDIVLVVAQIGCSRSVAAIALCDHGNDIVDALFTLGPTTTESSVNRWREDEDTCMAAWSIFSFWLKWFLRRL